MFGGGFWPKVVKFGQGVEMKIAKFKYASVDRGGIRCAHCTASSKLADLAGVIRFFAAIQCFLESSNAFGEALA